MFNVANLFRPVQQVQQVPNPQIGQGSGQQPGQTGQPQPGSMPSMGANNNGQVNNSPGSSMEPKGQQGQPGQQQQPGQQTNPGAPGANSQLEEFSSLWHTDPQKAATANADPWADPLFQVDPAKMRQAAGQIDFMSQVPQELVQKVMAGNDPHATIQLINAVGQAALATAMQVTTSTAEQVGSKVGQRFKTSMPKEFKNFQINHTPPKNPALSNPAIQPLLNMVKQQVKMNNPDFSPDQVNSMAEKYMEGVSGVLSPTGNANGGNASGAQTGDPFGHPESEQNWMDWGGFDKSQQ